MNETAEFEKWWTARQLELWRMTLLPYEKHLPMPEHWGAGFKRASREAWDARASLGKSVNQENEK